MILLNVSKAKTDPPSPMTENSLFQTVGFQWIETTGGL